MTPVGSLARLVTVALVAATGLLLPAAAPAVGQAGCRPGHGVTVVVDFHELDHPDVTACVPDGAHRDAARLLQDVGLRLTDVQRQPGFVCRVDGLPADDPCLNTPPAGAYWSLWWSDGTSGEWRYSTVMASSLDVPDGGFVALVWDQVADELRPSVRPGRESAAAAQRTVGAGRDSRGGSQAGGASGLPWWVTPVALAVLFGAASGIVAERRRQRRDRG